MLRHFSTFLILIVSSYGSILCSQNDAHISSTNKYQISDEGHVRSILDKMFKGMMDKDTAVISACFLPNAHLETAIFQNQDSYTKISSVTLQAFLNAIGGTPISTSLEERIDNVTVKVEENLAMAWTPYIFYINGKISHCGVNLFTLVLIKSEWKIKHIIDTRKMQHCESK